MFMFQKIKPLRSKKYLAWIREQVCCITGRQDGIVAHHIIDVGMNPGMGTKASDLFAIPMNSETHNLLHHDTEAFEVHHDQKKLALETIEKAVNEGVLSVC